MGDDWLCLYILIEFQSKVDPWMAVRMMSYVGLLYQDLIKAKQVLPQHKLPSVLPIVLYNGGCTLEGSHQHQRADPEGARAGGAVFAETD